MIKKLLSVLSLAVFGTGFGVNLAHGQAAAGQGAVAGVVTDATKAVIPGAHVVLANPSIGFKQEVVTNGEGYYKFSPLTVVGGYTIQVTAKGFTTGKITAFATSVGTVITENVSLSVGDAGTTVEVAGGTIEQVQTDTSTVSQVIDNQVFMESPLAVRNSDAFVGLAVGAVGDPAGTGRSPSVNGARTGAGDYQVEGFDNNDQGLAGGSTATVSPDAIQEYRVLTSVPNAEYGRAGGFATDTVLKSGTTRWHGSLFEYNRIQALAQENWFNSKTTPKLRDHLVYNQFGGSIGGPIYKDRTFFYATVEFYRSHSGSPSSFVGTTQDFYNFVKSGAYEKFQEGTAQQNGGVNPQAPTDGSVGVGFCPLYLGASCAGQLPDISTLGPVFNKNYAASPYTFPFATDSFSNELTDVYGGGGLGAPVQFLPVNVFGTGHITSISLINHNTGSLKLDHRLTNKDQLSFTYLAALENENHNTGGGDNSPGPPYTQVGGGQLFGARWTHTFTPNLQSEFHGNYTRHVSNFNATSPQGIPSQYTADALYTGFGATSGFPQLFTENEFAYEGNTTWAKGHHTFKGGFRYVRTRNGSSFYNDVYGTLYFWGTPGIMTDGLNEYDMNKLTGLDSTLGELYYASASQDPSTSQAPNPYRGFRANEYNAYVQDDWKVTPKLFVNYGVRWDYFGPPHNFQAGYDSNVFFGNATTVASTNAFAPGGSLYLAEQSGLLKCVGMVACGNPSAATAAGFAPASGTSTIWDRDVNNLGPRLGFSYDSTGNGKLVIRGGFGIGYDRLYNNVYENIRFNGPRFVDNATGYGAGAAAIPNSLRGQLVTSPFTGNSALSGAAAVPRHVNQHLKTAYYEQIHFGVETNVLKGYVIEANYIGTLGRQLVGLMNANTFEGRVACSTAAQKATTACKALTTAQQSTARPNATFGNDNFRTNGFSSNYSAGQVSIRRGYSHGFQFNANYTYSKAMDQISDVFTVKGGATGITTPYNPSHVYGPADYDQRHQFKLILNYQTQSSTHKLLLAGWGISPIVTMGSGTPLYMKDSSSTYDPNKDGTTGVEPVFYKGGYGNIKQSLIHGKSPAGNFSNNSKGTGVIKYDATKATGWQDYTCPTTVNNGLFCDVPGDRQNLYGLRGYDVDLALSKHFAITERYKLTLQAAFFDVDGHPQWANPVTDINSTSFGNSTSAGGREGQLSARFDF